MWYRKSHLSNYESQKEIEVKKFILVVLVLSGLAMLYACASRLIFPNNAIFLASQDENLKVGVNLLNEIRGVGGVLLLGAIVAFAGVFSSRFKAYSLAITSLIFSGIALGRLISIGIDGMPNTAVFRALIVECILGIINIYCFIKTYRSFQQD